MHVRHPGRLGPSDVHAVAVPTSAPADEGAARPVDHHLDRWSGLHVTVATGRPVNTHQRTVPRPLGVVWGVSPLAQAWLWVERPSAGHDRPMTRPSLLPRAHSAVWLDDLRWHKQMFRQSRFRWTGEHVMDILTRQTSGQLDFTTLRHLQVLQRDQNHLAVVALQCRLAMAEPLRQAVLELGGKEPVAEALGLSVSTCTATMSMASGAPAEERTNADVEHVLRGLPFSNPLIQAWELKQLWRLYEAACTALEDTICDLLVELAPLQPVAALREATAPASGIPGDRIRWARQERGEAGDPRRSAQQSF